MSQTVRFETFLEGQWWYIDRHLTLKGTRASADALYLDCIKQGVCFPPFQLQSYGF